MNDAEKYVREQLFAMQDLGYRDFHAKLVPNLRKEKIIGVRIPVLRKFAKEFSNDPRAAEFIKVLPHKYYEENNLHAFVIEQIKDYGECAAEVSRFLPFVDNWATCDSLSPKVFGKHKAELLSKIDGWMASEETYEVRFGIEMLMTHFLEGEFKPEYLVKVAAMKSEEYYVNMMAAWFFASACWSVFIAMNSTPCRPSLTMRLTALPPPPPTPMTLIVVTFSSISSSSMSAITFVLHCGCYRRPEHFAQNYIKPTFI